MNFEQQKLIARIGLRTGQQLLALNVWFADSRKFVCAPTPPNKYWHSLAYEYVYAHNIDSYMIIFKRQFHLSASPQCDIRLKQANPLRTTVR